MRLSSRTGQAHKTPQEMRTDGECAAHALARPESEALGSQCPVDSLVTSHAAIGSFTWSARRCEMLEYERVLGKR